MDWDAEPGEYLQGQRYVGKGPGGVVAEVELPSTVEGGRGFAESGDGEGRVRGSWLCLREKGSKKNQGQK